MAGTQAGTVLQSRTVPTFLTLGVLKAEAGLVSLRHLGAIGGQDVVVGEDIHAVVVPARGSPQRPGCTSAWMLGSLEDAQGGGADGRLALPCGRTPPPARPLAVREGPHSPCSEAAVLRGWAELSPALGGDTAVPSQMAHASGGAQLQGTACGPVSAPPGPPAPTLLI